MKKDTAPIKKRRYAPPKLRTQAIQLGVFGDYGGCPNPKPGGQDGVTPGADRSWWWNS